MTEENWPRVLVALPEAVDPLGFTQTAQAGATGHASRWIDIRCESLGDKVHINATAKEDGFVMTIEGACYFREGHHPGKPSASHY